MPEILPIQRTILSNQSIKISKAHQFLKYTSYLGLCNPIGFLCFVSCLFCFFVLVLCVCFYFVFFICFVFILTKLVVASVLCLQNPHFFSSAGVGHTLSCIKNLPLWQLNVLCRFLKIVEINICISTMKLPYS